MGVSGWMFLLVPAYPGSPGQKAVKRLCVCVCLKPTVTSVHSNFATTNPHLHSHYTLQLASTCPFLSKVPFPWWWLESNATQGGTDEYTPKRHRDRFSRFAQLAGMHDTDTWATLRATCVGKGRIYATRCHTDLTLAKQKYQFIKFNA